MQKSRVVREEEGGGWGCLAGFVVARAVTKHD